eukprot:9307874-Pyramimonas_sp.AAC.1
MTRIRILFQLAQYISKLMAAQVEFMVRGGFNMSMADLEGSSLVELEVLFAVPRAAKCRPTQVSQHSTIDYG